MVKRPKNIWIGQYYFRGGEWKDKHGNIRKEPVTLRSTNQGYVSTLKGQFQGVEPPKKHHYGNDPKRIKKPETYVRPNNPSSVKRRSGHMRKL